MGGFVHAYWHSHHWILVAKDVVESDLQSWMHKSILLLKVLAASSENVIDPYPQLYPFHRPCTVRTNQHFIICCSETPILISPPAGRQGCGREPQGAAACHGLASWNWCRKWPGQLENRGPEVCPCRDPEDCPCRAQRSAHVGAKRSTHAHGETSFSRVSHHSCRVRGLQPGLGVSTWRMVLLQQRSAELWRRKTSLKCTKAWLVHIEGIFDTYIWLVNQLQIIPFSCSFLTSKLLNIITPTFEQRSYFVLWDWYLWILFMVGS